MFCGVCLGFLYENTKKKIKITHNPTAILISQEGHRIFLLLPVLPILPLVAPLSTGWFVFLAHTHTRTFLILILGLQFSLLLNGLT